jgi:hypothetical protein
MEYSQEQKTYAKIVQKAWDDADFKKELTDNPVAAIEKLTGNKFNVPAGKTIVVRDQTDEATYYINIPAKLSMDVELNEEQLEAAAGGTGGTGGFGGTIFNPDDIKTILDDLNPKPCF